MNDDPVTIISDDKYEDDEYGYGVWGWCICTSLAYIIVYTQGCLTSTFIHDTSCMIHHTWHIIHHIITVPFCPAYLSLAAKDSPPEDDEYEPAFPSNFAELVLLLLPVEVWLRYIEVDGTSLSAIKAATRPVRHHQIYMAWMHRHQDRWMDHQVMSERLTWGLLHQPIIVLYLKR
jgi:hypothetical protein